MAAPARTVSTAAVRLIAVCGKCGKKLGGGFGGGGDRSLAKALKRAAPHTKGKRKRVRIVETKCLDICPRGAVALIDARRPGEVVIVPRDTPVDVVAAQLELGADVTP